MPLSGGIESINVNALNASLFSTKLLKTPRAVLAVLWKEDDARLNQLVACTKTNWNMFQDSLRNGTPICSTQAGSFEHASFEATGPVSSVLVYVWDGDFYYTEEKLGGIDWIPGVPTSMNQSP